jgi:hypothetical protein
MIDYESKTKKVILSDSALAELYRRRKNTSIHHDKSGLLSVTVKEIGRKL